MCDRGGNTGTVSALYLSRASPSHMAFAFSVLTVWFYVCVYVCMCLFASHTNVQASVILPVCVFLTIVRPFVRRPVSSDVHLLWSAHLRVIMKATFDFNLS